MEKRSRPRVLTRTRGRTEYLCEHGAMASSRLHFSAYGYWGYAPGIPGRQGMHPPKLYAEKLVPTRKQVPPPKGGLGGRQGIGGHTGGVGHGGGHGSGSGSGHGGGGQGIGGRGFQHGIWPKPTPRLKPPRPIMLPHDTVLSPSTTKATSNTHLFILHLLVSNHSVHECTTFSIRPYRPAENGAGACLAPDRRLLLGLRTHITRTSGAKLECCGGNVRYYLPFPATTSISSI